jgi:non-specific serine/threonine protein kinase
MRLLALSGATREASRFYHRLKDALRRELDVEPEEAATRLYEEILLARPSALVAAPARKHNLPTPLTTFIGRHQESADVKRLLQSTRLLTLTGPGGCGKTRLAIEVASTLLDLYPDGVRLVELAGLSDPALVPQGVATALDAQEQPGRTLTETLVSLIDTKTFLLLLDNCEHLVEACATLAESLLHGCPNLQILATSREPLNIPGETAWIVPSLTLPERGVTPTLESLAQHEATRLFLDRAAHSLPGFNPTHHDAPSIAQICLQLDGMPLAIELAAARTRVLSHDQIASRLSDSSRLLAGGSRTTSPRHRTLRAAISWSYNLLPPAEQLLFRRLSIFAGTFTLEAAESVCSGGLIEQPHVLDLLSHLVDKSLVQLPPPDAAAPIVPGSGGVMRYRLLETLRQFGRECLQENGETEAAEHRHALYYSALAERAGPELHGPHQVAWLHLLDRELDNLRAAIEWSQRSSATAGLTIVGNLWWFWEARGYQTEGRRWLAALLPQAPARTLARGRALHCGAALALRQGDSDQCRAFLTESLAIFRELGDRPGIADVLERLGLFNYAFGDYARSTLCLRRSLEIFRDLDNKPGIGWTLTDLGMVARISGDFDRARPLLEEALLHLREWGDRLGLAYALNNLGQLLRLEGDYARAQSLLEESLEAARETGNKPFLGWALLALGEVARRRDNITLARACYSEGVRVARDVGYIRHVSQGLGMLGVLAAQQSDYPRAVALISASEAIHSKVRVSLDLDEAVSWDQALSDARAALDESAMDAAALEGRSLVLTAPLPNDQPPEPRHHLYTPTIRPGGIELALAYAQG